MAITPLERIRSISQNKDLEQIILESPEVQSAISRLAERRSLGRNPVLRYLAEQARHADYHILGIESEKHPKLTYPSPKSLLKALKNYVLNLPVHLFYHSKSALVGTDKISGRGLPNHLLEVGRNVNRDAKRMRLEARARGYFKEMVVELEPAVMKFSRERAKRFVDGSFSGVSITGLEEKIEGGESVLDILRDEKRSVAIFESHPTYPGIMVSLNTWAERGVNMFYVAGKNIVDNMGPEFKRIVRKSGAILIDRRNHMGKYGLLYHAVLNAYISQLLSAGSNVTIYIGSGRQKGGRIEPLNSTVTSAIIDSAYAIAPLAESYEVIPDDAELAAGKRRKDGNGASMGRMLELERNDCGNAYGGVFLNFGEPINPGDYDADSKKSMNRLEEDITKQIISLVTLTPTYALASVVKDSCIKEFDITQIRDDVWYFVNSAKSRGIHVAPEELEEYGFLDVILSTAAERLVARNALTSLGNETFGKGELLEFYANQARQTLEQH